MASFSQQSQRYVNMNGASFCIPSSVIENEEALSKFTNVSDKIQECYSAMVEAGIPAEDARYVLPNAVETKVVMTANARSLMNFFEIRLCSRAQWEIRELAGKMRDAVLPIAPNIFKHAGPTCETQEYCREGTMTCGRLG
jgi:thymidylate synthase (FAD)